MLPTREGFVSTPTGRRLSFTSVGPRDGLPVVYLHGGIGSPVEHCPQLDELITRLHIRHITVARPGFGRSDPAPGRSILDFAADLERVADHLGVGRLALVGVSSGGPYALASTLALPDRIAATGVVSCLSPHQPPHECRAMAPHLRRGLGTLVRHPDFVERVSTGLIGMLERYQPLAARLTMVGANRADRSLLADERTRDAAMARFLHTAAGGVRGMIDDYALCCAPWGFALEDIAAQVHLWHGADDQFVPLEHARRLAGALPRCRVTIGTDDGHFFYRRRMGDVLGTLVDAAHGAATRTRVGPLRAAA
jgi:pimeloyl-ACP methyl ester carboxylesterase